MHRLQIDFRPDFFLGLCFAFLILPLKLTLAWFAAAMIHEISHYVVLCLTKTSVYRVCIGIGGATMETEPMSSGKELLCALAGPVGGFMLLFFIRWMPLLAICGCLQSVYNLLPVFPLDGGRALKCLLKKTALSPKIYRFVETTVFVLLALGALYLTFQLLLGPLPLIAVAILFLKVKFSCKQVGQGVQ